MRTTSPLRGNKDEEEEERIQRGMRKMDGSVKAEDLISVSVEHRGREQCGRPSDLTPNSAVNHTTTMETLQWGVIGWLWAPCCLSTVKKPVCQIQASWTRMLKHCRAETIGWLTDKNLYSVYNYFDYWVRNFQYFFKQKYQKISRSNVEIFCFSLCDIKLNIFGFWDIWDVSLDSGIYIFHFWLIENIYNKIMVSYNPNTFN